MQSLDGLPGAYPYTSLPLEVTEGAHAIEVYSFSPFDEPAPQPLSLRRAAAAGGALANRPPTPIGSAHLC